jgi:hypothetical protein
MAGKAAGWVEWNRRAVFTSNVRDFSPPSSLIRVKATALLCSLNILALPAQDEPTCICGRDCLVKPRLLLQSFCARVQSAEPHSKGRMPMWRRTSTPSMRPRVSSGSRLGASEAGIRAAKAERASRTTATINALFFILGKALPLADLAPVVVVSISAPAAVPTTRPTIAIAAPSLALLAPSILWINIHKDRADWKQWTEGCSTPFSEGFFTTFGDVCTENDPYSIT